MPAPKRPRLALALLLYCAAFCLAACDASPLVAPGVDASRADASARCASDDVCDDGVFCNGVERCAPSSTGAGPDGCVAAAAPACGGDATCDELASRCVVCSAEGDMDGDGARSLACGGDDCDDEDPRRHPGAPEVCDAEGLDEDCDPSTLGPDADGDGAIEARCCNLQPDGSARCGTDCDDMNLNVAPGAPEICDGIDNDCDGALDYPGEDDDGDGWADCVDLPDAIRDCDDTQATVHPGAPEICDGFDSDCDGVRARGDDEDHDGFAAIGAACTGGAPATDCDDHDYLVRPDLSREICDGRDNDCDGEVDESCAGLCDPATDAGIADLDAIEAAFEGCFAECSGDANCQYTCFVRWVEARASGECLTCLDAVVAVAVRTDAPGRCSESGSCVATLCGLNYFSNCTGLALDICPDTCSPTLLEPPKSILGRAIDAYGRCRSDGCDDDACLHRCLFTYVGARCGTCFTELRRCEDASCSEACAMDPDRACRACLARRCDMAFAACTGGSLGPVCGDGVVSSGELCDDGNTSDCGTCLDYCEGPSPGRDCPAGTGCISSADCGAGLTCTDGWCR